MFGAEWEGNEQKRPLAYSRHSLDDPSTHGIIPRSVHDIFNEVGIKGGNFTILTSFLQIYNEKIFDLL